MASSKHLFQRMGVLIQTKSNFINLLFYSIKFDHKNLKITPTSTKEKKDVKHATLRHRGVERWFMRGIEEGFV